jgi:hypothetical protein
MDTEPQLSDESESVRDATALAVSTRKRAEETLQTARDAVDRAQESLERALAREKTMRAWFKDVFEADFPEPPGVDLFGNLVTEDWTGKPRTTVVRWAVLELTRQRIAATPKEIHRFLRSKGRNDGLNAISGALSYLKGEGSVQSAGYGHWKPSVGSNPRGAQSS